jgi:Leucine-rich repeat (LRR) protein
LLIVNSISNLENIESLKNLKQLILFNNEIRQISNLSALKNLIVLNIKGNYLCENTQNLSKHLLAPKIKKLYIGRNPKNLVVKDEFLPESQDCKPLNKNKCPFGEESKVCIFD